MPNEDNPANGAPAEDVAAQKAKLEKLASAPIVIRGRGVRLGMITIGDQMDLMTTHRDDKQRLLMEMIARSAVWDDTGERVWADTEEMFRDKVPFSTTLKLVKQVQEANPIEDDPS
jgi:hypothetical protein